VNDGNAASNDQGSNAPRVRWRLILPTVAVIICLIVTTAIGSILVNVNWPETLGAWLKALLGGLLLLIGTIGITYAAPSVKAVIKDGGGLRSGNQGKYIWLERLGNAFTVQRAVMSVVLAAVIFVAATLSPRISLPPPPAPLEPGPIRVMSAIDESERDPRYMLIKQWNTAHPDNQVELTTVSGETDDQHESMVTDAKKERYADVYVLDIVWMPEFIKNGYIRAIDESKLVEYDGDQFLDNVWKTCRDSIGGKDGLWALPFNSDAGLLYYRSDLRVTAPETWGGYFGTSAKATLAGVRSMPGIGGAAAKIEAANAAQLDEEEVLTVNALEAMWAAGGEVVNESGRVVLNADLSEVVFDTNALAGLKDLAAASQDPDITLSDSDKADELDSANAFKDGRALFMRNWPVAHDNLMTSSNKDAIPFKVTSLSGSSVLGGQNLAISSATKKPRAAQELIEFLASPLSQLTLFEVGGFAPTRPSAYPNSRRPYAQDLRSAIERARPRPALVHYTEFSIEFRTGISRALKAEGELEPDFAQKLAQIVKKG
jgi:multiple sugar transport system substrate-binding protein